MEWRRETQDSDVGRTGLLLGLDFGGMGVWVLGKQDALKKYLLNE